MTDPQNPESPAPETGSSTPAGSEPQAAPASTPPAAEPAQQPYQQQPYGQQAPAYGQQAAYPQQGYAQPGQPYAAAGYAPAPPKTLSIVSMIAGIASIFLFPIVGSIVGLITGSMGKKQEGLPAKPFWLTGIITSWVGLGLWVLGGLLVLLSVLIPLLIFGAAAGSGAYDY